MTTIITATDLLNICYEANHILGLTLDAAQQLQTGDREATLALLQKLKDYPESFLEDPALKDVALAMVAAAEKAAQEAIIPLKDTAVEYASFGDAFIEEGAKQQMSIAARLPVAVGAALMPDAHQGYGLPIGGVLATRGAIIPYGVGVDIGCRMALTVFDIPESHFEEKLSQYKRELVAQTKFGAGKGFKGREKADHAVLDSSAFKATSLLRGLHERAYAQLGTSGGGNHFVEFGIIDFAEADETLNVPEGRYLALLTHSGSRGLGATVAGHYTHLAKQLCKLPQEAQNLAWLDMNSEAGQEYWLAMNLAGDYASACHEVIHQKITKAIGGTVLAKVENHHNFAWKEQWNGEEVLVHRKGATPAGKGVLGIIPGSMTAPGFLVRGKGNEQSINSASHGAGRQMSRSKAIKSITKAEMQAMVKDAGVMLIGSGLDEAPIAYKDIHTVMAAQTALVDTIASFTPKMVRMADDGSRED